MALRNFRHWLIKRIPLEAPKQSEVEIAGVVDDFGHVAPLEVSLPNLHIPDYSSDLSALPSELIPVDMSSIDLEDLPLQNLHSVIILPEVGYFPIDSFESHQEILDLLEELKYPGKAGKAYAANGDIDEQDFAPAQIPIEMMENCRHGLQKYSCDICLREIEERKRKRKGIRKGQKNPHN